VESRRKLTGRAFSVQPIGRTLQAAVTWETVAGTTYFVQIGGFPDSFAYGNLRVAVR
jgi:hypothetical protein